MDAKYPAVGVVTHASGKVKVESDDKTHVLKSGDVIYQHDKIVTDDGASVSLIMTDGKLIDIGSDSSKNIDEVKEVVPVDVIQNALNQSVSPQQISDAIIHHVPIADILPIHFGHLYYVPWGTLGKVESGFPTSHEIQQRIIHQEESRYGLMPHEANPIPATPIIDLNVIKTDYKLEAIPGTYQTYTITIINSGPSTYTGTINDILPSSILNPSWFASFSGGATDSNPLGAGNIIDNVIIPKGGEITYTITGFIDPSATGTLSNTVTASIPNGVINVGNNTSTDIDTLTPQVDLCVIKTDYKHSVVPGQENTYTIIVKNEGPSQVDSITLTDNIPQDFLNPAFSPSVGSYDSNTHVWSGLNLGHGDSISMTVTGTIDPNATGTITNYVIVNPLDGVTDTNPDNNNAHDTDCLTPQVDLSIQKTDSVGGIFNPETNNTTGGSALNDTIVTYTLTVHNSGPSNAVNVVVTDTLPAGLVDINPGTGMISSGTITWNLGDMASGQTVTLSFQGTLDYSELPNATEVLFAGLTNNSSSSQVFDSWSNSAVTLYAFDFSTPFENSSHIIQLSNADQTVAYNSNGIGVTGTNNGQVPDQINHSSNNITDDSQALGVALNNSASSATIQVNNLFLNENTGEYGKVTAFDATGKELNSFVFGNGSGTNGSAVASHFGSEFVAVNYFTGSVSQGSFTITSAMAGGDFSYLVFSAMPYGAGAISQQFPNNDSSDYFVQAIHYTVLSQTGENIVNTVNVTSDTTDTNPNNDNSTDTIQINHADLAITKTDGLTTAIPGQEDTYTITVTNNGAFDVNGAKVTDYLPSQYVASSWTATQTGGASGFTPAGSGDISDTVNIPVGATITYTVHGTIAADATGNLVNFATVTPPSGVIDSNMSNNIATDTDTLNLTADLSITKTDGKSTVIPGDTDSYTIVVHNNGVSNVTGANVVDNVPANFTNVTWTDSLGHSGSGSINQLVNLAAGASITYTVTGTISAAATGSLINTATVTAPNGTTDPTPGNNSATDTDTLNPTADLSITKTDGKTTVIPGDTDSYTIVVHNNGLSNVTGANVVDNVPANFTNVTWTDSLGHSGSGSINQLVNLAAGASITYTVTGTISAAATGSLVNTATVTAPNGTTDPTPGNNSATDTDTLTPTVDLSITKTDGHTIINNGVADTYTIVVSNSGPSNVVGATVTDNLPAGFIVTNWSSTAAGGATGNDVSGTGNINDTGVNIPVGGSVTYTVHGTISPSATGVLSNTAIVVVGAGETDSNPNNNTATDTTTINGIPSCNSASALVVESALSTGTNPSSNAEISSNTLGYNFGADGKAATLPFTWTIPAGSFTSAGHAVTWSVSANGLTLTGTDSVTHQAVMTAVLTNVNTGAYTVTLLGQFDHPIANQTGSNDQISIPLGFTIKDGNGDTSSSTLSVAVNDDGPIVHSLTQSVTSNPQLATNLELLVDVSGSMDTDVTGLTNVTRLQLEKSALIDLLDQYNNLGPVSVKIVTFSSDSSELQPGSWMTLDQAKSAINALSADGFTNYDAPVATGETAFAETTGKQSTSNLSTPNVQNILYFTSDGQPNVSGGSEGSSGITGSEITSWQNFLTTNNINSFSLGLGTGSTQSALDPLAYNGTTNTDTNALIVNDLTQLGAVLTSTVPTSQITGNILTDSGSVIGADQSGFIKVISLDTNAAGHAIETFTYDGANGLTHTGGAAGTFTFTTISPTSHVLEVHTDLGGIFDINMNTYAYTYTPPTNLTGAITETVNYTFSDFDHDTGSAALNLTVSHGDHAPIAFDDHVITNISGSGAAIAIPDLALLFNDTDADGNAISITGVSNAASGNVTHAGSVVTFTDNNTNGGSFTYTATANSLTDTGDVSVSRVSGSTINGDGLPNILIANNSSTTLNGNEGNDVLIGGTANDTLKGDIGNDLLKGGLGNDTLTGGAGADIFLFAKADINISLPQTDTIIDFTKSQGDVLDLSDLLTGGSPALGSNPTATQLDSYLTFSHSGSSTKLTIDANGTTGGANVSHTVTFQGTDLFAQFGNAGNSHDLIANMQAAQQIVAHG